MRNISGFRPKQGSIVINQLAFADDYLLITKADGKEIEVLEAIV